MQVLTKLLNNMKISADLIVKKDSNNKAYTLNEDRVLLWSGLVSGYSSTFNLSDDYTNYKELLFIVSTSSDGLFGVVCPVVEESILPGCNLKGAASFEAFRIWVNTINSTKSIKMNTYVCKNETSNSGLTITKVYGIR